MLKRHCTLVVVFLVAILFSAKVEAGTEMCHSCTDLQMEAVAWDRIAQIQQYGPLYVVDLDRGVVRKYIYRNNMTPEYNPEFDAFEAWVESAPVEPQLATAIMGIKQGMVTMKAESAEVLHIPSNPGLPTDVYDALLNPAREQALLEYIRQENKWEIMFNNWLEQFDIPFFNEDFLWYPQPIEYSGGDTAIYIYNKETMKWERVPDSSRDAAGNVVPETKSDIHGGSYREYEFVNIEDPNVQGAMDDLANYARLNGINVVDASHGQLTTPGGYYVVTCTETTCTIWYIQ